jgi:hypothetical protein
MGLVTRRSSGVCVFMAAFGESFLAYKRFIRLGEGLIKRGNEQSIKYVFHEGWLCMSQKLVSVLGSLCMTYTIERTLIEHAGLCVLTVSGRRVYGNIYSLL